MLIYGDLDKSELRELPPGRTPVETWLRTRDQRDEVYEFVDAQVARGSNAGDQIAVRDVAELLAQSVG